MATPASRQRRRGDSQPVHRASASSSAAVNAAGVDVRRRDRTRFAVAGTQQKRRRRLDAKLVGVGLRRLQVLLLAAPHRLLGVKAGGSADLAQEVVGDVAAVLLALGPIERVREVPQPVLVGGGTGHLARAD